MSILTTAVTAAVTWGACVMARQEVEEQPPREGRWFRLRPTVNRGAAFGLPLEPRVLPVLSASSLALVWAMGRKCPAAAGLVLGGGLSNLWERADRGEVLDYLHFPGAPGPLGRYVYNLADLAILAGGLGLAAGRRKKRPGSVKKSGRPAAPSKEAVP